MKPEKSKPTEEYKECAAVFLVYRDLHESEKGAWETNNSIAESMNIFFNHFDLPYKAFTFNFPEAAQIALVGSLFIVSMETAPQPLRDQFSSI